MKARFQLVAFAALACLAGAVRAESSGQSPEHELHWRCWYDRQAGISCVVDAVPPSGSPSLPALPPDLPAVVRAMRAKPGSLRGRIVYIPLLTEPYDMAFTATLARAVVCGSRHDCVVDFNPRPPRAEELVALLDPDPADTGEGDAPWLPDDGPDVLEDSE